MGKNKVIERPDKIKEESTMIFKKNDTVLDNNHTLWIVKNRIIIWLSYYNYIFVFTFNTVKVA